MKRKNEALGRDINEFIKACSKADDLTNEYGHKYVVVVINNKYKVVTRNSAYFNGLEIIYAGQV